MKTGILCATMALSAVLAFAGGKTTPLNVEVVKAKTVETAIAADPDASVTWAAIKADLDAVETALDAIDLSTIDPGAFTGAQKTCVQNLKGALSSLKSATKNLMQAARKEVKKQKETERIQKSVL